MDAREAAGAASDWTVVCLCAEWCDTCRDYRRLFAARAAAADDAVHLWVDIEDEADALGDLDIETFPTLLVLHRERPLFFGPVLPQPEVIDALLRRLHADDAAIEVASQNGAALRWLIGRARQDRRAARER
jgi:thioredoxin-like negative regulator of GroEL